MATLGNAKALGLDASLGSIEPRKQADLVLIGADPLEDISNTKDIKRVLMKGHTVFDNMA